jgi:uncharacterized protein (DUF1697 family)
MQTHVALLRGINVGGNNIIKMTDLKACFESMKLENVRTYIQSGNVLFSSSEESQEQLAETIEKKLEKQFKIPLRVVLVSEKALRKAIEKAPKGFGKHPEKYRYDVIFLRASMTAKEAMQSITTKEGVDEATAGNDVLYFS